MHSYRGFLALVVVLALALGTGRPMPAAAAMQSHAQASNLIMGAMASDLSMSGMCDKCVKRDPAAQGCFAVCVGVQAVLPIAIVLRIAAQAPLDSLADRQFNSAAAPPDLPPPKLSGLV